MTAFEGGSSPNFQLLELHPIPAHYWRPVRVDLFQNLTRDASLQLDVQPQQQAHLGGCPKDTAVTLGLAARTLEMHFYFQPLY